MAVCNLPAKRSANNFSRIFALCIPAVFFSVCAFSHAEKSVVGLDELLLQLEKRHGTMKTMAAQFRQEKYFSFMTKPVVSKGFILFSSPDQIRFDIVSPFATTLLDDGKKAVRYEFVGGEWRRVQFGGGKSIQFVLDQIGQWMQGRFSQQRNLFELSVFSGDPNSYACLDMKPKPKQLLQFIEYIRVHISGAPGYRISRIDIFEPGGDRFSLIFTCEVVDPEFPEKCFSDPETAGECIKLFLKCKKQGQTEEKGGKGGNGGGTVGKD